MQRLVSNLAGRPLTATITRCCTSQKTSVCATILTTHRLASSGVPPSFRPPTAAGVTRADGSSSVAAEQDQASAPELDAKAAEQVRLAQDIGEEAFGENTAILKQVGYRGLRAFVVCAIGMGTFMWAMKKKKRELADSKVGKAGSAEEDEDPTQRYLEEMRSLGFDVDTLEEELEQERAAKLPTTK